jgi:hypothetical protein
MEVWNWNIECFIYLWRFGGRVVYHYELLRLRIDGAIEAIGMIDRV